MKIGVCVHLQILSATAGNKERKKNPSLIPLAFTYSSTFLPHAINLRAIKVNISEFYIQICLPVAIYLSGQLNQYFFVCGKMICLNNRSMMHVILKKVAKMEVKKNYLYIQSEATKATEIE